MIAAIVTLALFGFILTLVVDVMRRDGAKILAAMEGQSWVAGPTEGEVSESSEIIGSLYTTPVQMDVFLQTNNLHEWEGFAPYTTYQNDEGSEFEITPSVTLTPTAAAQ